MDLGLTNQVVLIAGSSKGIGRGIAFGLLGEGARVVISGRDRAQVDATLAELGEGNQSLGFVGDLLNPADINACIEAVTGRWGRVDHLVANIGSGRGHRGWAATEADWQRFLDVNLLGAVRLARAVIPHLAQGSSIVFVASIAGVEYLEAPAGYTAAKAALIAYAKSIARDVASRGVRANVVAPGNVLFPGSTWDAKLRDNREATLAYIEREVPLKRFGTPEDIAHAVAFLVSARASFVTGTCLVVDGGQTRRW